VEASDKLYDSLIRPIEQQMIRIVGRIVRDNDDAEDAFQEILAVIWAKLNKIEKHPNPHAYILRICVTRSYDTLRKRARRRRFEILLDNVKAKVLAVHPPDFAKDYDRRSAVRESIAMLPPNQAQTVLLRLVDETPYHKIGSILGCSEATARSHFSKGRARLQKILAGMNIL
jgi:RNA polymerase sigma factor (sigma-70 family)